MSDFAKATSRHVVRRSVGGWALAIVIAFIVLIVTGVLPHVLG